MQQRRVGFHRRHHLDPALQVAVHPVCRADVELGVVVVLAGETTSTVVSRDSHQRVENQSSRELTLPRPNHAGKKNHAARLSPKESAAAVGGESAGKVTE